MSIRQYDYSWKLCLIYSHLSSIYNNFEIPCVTILVYRSNTIPFIILAPFNFRYTKKMMNKKMCKFTSGTIELIEINVAIAFSSHRKFAIQITIFRSKCFQRPSKCLSIENSFYAHMQSQETNVLSSLCASNNRKWPNKRLSQYTRII